MAPRIVYNMHDGAYQKFPFICFKVNLKDLRESVKLSLNDALMDQERLKATLKLKFLIPEVQSKYPQWRYSRAHTLIIENIHTGVIKQIEAAEHAPIPTGIHALTPWFVSRLHL